MRLVPLIVEFPSTVPEPPAVTVTHRLDHVPWFEENLSDVGINALEPHSELLVLSRVANEVVDGGDDDIERDVIREAFEEGADLDDGDFEVGVLLEGGMRVFAVCGDGLAMSDVLLDEAEKPANGFLVVVVPLTLEDDLEANVSVKGWVSERKKPRLLATVDELITTLLWEVLLRKELAAALEFLTSGVLVLLWNTFGDVALVKIPLVHRETA